MVLGWLLLLQLSLGHGGDQSRVAKWILGYSKIRYFKVPFSYYFLAV
jgi:hypothetical protein